MPHEHHFAAVTSWAGETTDYASYSREYTYEVRGKPVLTGSAAGAFRGDERLMNPEDMLLGAVSACHLLSYLAECARSGIVVTRYEDQCMAKMMFQDGKMRIVEAELHPRVTIREGDHLELAERLHEKAHDLCFIANSVNFPIAYYAEVVTEHR